VLNRRIGVVVKAAEGPFDSGVQQVSVDIEGMITPAVNYIELSGMLTCGDQVLLNTTAVDLGLGTGGVHFVISNLSHPAMNTPPSPGHIMKLRYTPLQTAVLSVEEDDNPSHQSIREFESLSGTPVICCELHSQIAVIAAGLKAIKPDSRIAYIMTDGAALPIGFSRLVLQLKEKGLVDSTITCGQAFGGDIEAINLYTGLISAVKVARADAVIVCQGPGNAGACSKYGFSGIQQGEAINAVNILGGSAIASLRMSFADPRERHRGISHHSVTVLKDISIRPAIVAVPELSMEQSEAIRSQLDEISASGLHTLRVCSGRQGITELKRRGVNVTTMGRSIDQDMEFFLAASSAGIVAANMIEDTVSR